jgi:hypothetical protein
MAPSWVSDRMSVTGWQQLILKRRLFTLDHEIWDHLDENDVLAIRTFPPLVGRTSRVSNGRVLFWDKFDPTLLG